MCVSSLLSDGVSLLLLQLGIVIAHELFPDVIDWFSGTNQAGNDDSDEEYSEEDDENEDEIDLEKPRTKKQRM